MLSPHCTEGIPPLYWIPSTVLMLSPTVLMLSPACTDVIPPMYWIPSTVLTLSPTVLMLSPTVLNNLHSTEGIPHSTEAIAQHVLPLSPHSTEGIPPQYWCYPQHYWCYPPHVLMLSPHCTEQPPQYWSYPPTVLKLSPHCTEQPPQYWSYPPTVLMLSPRCTEQPPMYWTTSTVLNRRYMGWFQLLVCDRSISVIVNTNKFFGLKCLTETKIQFFYDHVDHTRFYIVEMSNGFNFCPPTLLDQQCSSIWPPKSNMASVPSLICKISIFAIVG